MRPLIKHEKAGRAQGVQRISFDKIQHSDNVVSIEESAPTKCRCLTVEEDESFVYQGVAVHNSRILSCFFPSFVWLHQPGARFLCLSVNEDAALRDARDSKMLIQSPWYQETFEPNWKLKIDQEAASNFANTKGRNSYHKGAVCANYPDCVVISYV